jgi:hypothetical protein
VSTDPGEHQALREYLERLERTREAVRGRLARFETEFGMDSETFYARLQNAELDERQEYAEWAGEHEMLRRLEAQIEELKRRLEK